MKIKYGRIIKKVVFVFVHNIMNLAFYDICFINLKIEMNYSLQFQHCEISMRQIGYIVLFFFAKSGINCLNIKSDVPVKQIYTQIAYLKKC